MTGIVLYSILILLLLIGCLLTASGLLLAAACVALVTPLVSFLLVRSRARWVTLTFEAANITEKNRELPVVLKATSAGPIPRGKLRVVLEIANQLTGETTELVRDMRDSLTFNVASAYAGEIRITVKEARLYDWFGFFSKKLTTLPRKKILVMPATFPMQVADRRTLTNQDDVKEYAPDRKGQDVSETFQVREYVPGDSIRSIHWKLSGKMQKLYVRDASYPVDHSLLVVCDRAEACSSPACADALLEAVTSAARALADEGLAFTLVWQDETIHTLEVTDGSQLPEAAGLLLKAARPGEGSSLWQAYTAAYGQANAGRVLYFAENMPVDVPEGPLFRVFVAGTTDEDTGDGPVIFSPEGMGETLRSIE
ncbi:MAG: DUF58 domain-containing protein [Lachnospiraceae bacterium]|nr:DUF58 domain-containing protein [Lachnospiraceae bacterium]